MRDRLCENFAELARDWLRERDPDPRSFPFPSRREQAVESHTPGELGDGRLELAAAEFWRARLDAPGTWRALRELVFLHRHRGGAARWSDTSGQPPFDPAGRLLGYPDRGMDAAADGETEARLLAVHAALQRANRRLAARNEELRAANERLRDEIARREGLERELRHLAETDGLTGLPNRRHFMERGEATLAHARPARLPSTLLLFDLDRFKLVNDRYGHAVGDAALVAFGAILPRALRRGDIAGRLGGEEFAALLPETDREQGREIAERVRAATTEIRVPASGERARLITVSVGAAQCRSDEESLTPALARADCALYRAKQAGRNRVVCEV